MATLETLRRTVGRKTGMEYSAAGTDRDLIDSWCSEAVREILIRTHCYTAATTVETTADEWQYDLSSNVMVVKLIWRDGETSDMVRVAPDEIIELRRSNSTSSSDSSLMWAMVGTNMLMFHPTPTSVFTVSLVYVPRPTELSFDTHDPSNPAYGGIPVEYHKAIELWALSNASDHEHEGRTQSGQKYLVEFEAYIARIKAGVNRKGGRLPAARVGRARRPITDNGVYPR